jgi:hypothetical protein
MFFIHPDVQLRIARDRQEELRRIAGHAQFRRQRPRRRR